MMRNLRSRKIIAGAGLVLAPTVAVVLAVFATGGESGVRAFGGPVTIPAMSRTPAEAQLPPAVARWATIVGRSAGMDQAQAKKGVHKLRDGMGSKQSATYAFTAPSGTICFYTQPQSVGACSTAKHDSDGFHWAIGGGSPAGPSALVAIVEASVSAVRLDVDGQAIPVSLANDVAYAEFPDDADHATITVEHTDGTTRAIDVKLTPAN